jgi:hypothetical protein
MSPSPSFPDRRNKAHTDAIFIGQYAPAPKHLGVRQYLSDLGLRQFRCMAIFATRDFSGVKTGVMSIPPKDAIGLSARPMIVSTGECCDNFRRSAPPMSPPMPFPIISVLLWCGPIKVARSIVRFIAVPMGAMHGWIGLVPIKRGAHQRMGGSVQMPNANAQNISRVPSDKSGLEHSPKVFSLPVGGHALDPAAVRNGVIRRFFDGYPLFSFHNRTLAYNVGGNK